MNSKHRRLFSCFTLVISSFFFLLIGCNQDFEINSEYDESVVVFAILNSQDSVQYIRISRSVLNTSSESLDSIIIDPVRSGFPEPLDVWVVRWGYHGQIGYPIPFFVDTLHPINGNSQGNSGNTLYSTTRIIEPGSTYRLFVTNPTTQKTLTASCYSLNGGNLYYQIDNTFNNISVACLDSVYFYQTEMYFSFVEVYPEDTVYRRIPLFTHTLANESKSSGSTMKLSLDRPDIMELIGKNLQPDSRVRRYALRRPYSYRLILGDEILFDYQNTLERSNQKYQSAQTISNIRGGKGIFSSVFSKSLGSIYMPDYWYTSLSQNQFTRKLNFQSIPWND